MPLFGPPDVSKLKAKKDIKGIVKALYYKKDSSVQCDAADALGELGGPGAAEAGRALAGTRVQVVETMDAFEQQLARLRAA